VAPDPARPEPDPVPARQGRAPMRGRGDVWRGDDGDGLRPWWSWLGATASNGFRLWRPEEVEAEGMLRASVSCEGVALNAVSVATSVAHTARCSWFHVPSRRGWRLTQLCGCCISRPIGAPSRGFAQKPGRGDGRGCMFLPGVLAFSSVGGHLGRKSRLR
jgi:hypothetical protein